ncbi:MAG TPA: hypothetical protein VG777_00675 [Thermoanaerobaculia bacterium]|nr:hypothetical protein [Thermoanaerobaculia bacterium]
MSEAGDRPGRIVPPQEPPSPRRPEPPVVTPPGSPGIPPEAPPAPIGDPVPSQPPIQAAD